MKGILLAVAGVLTINVLLVLLFLFTPIPQSKPPSSSLSTDSQPSATTAPAEQLGQLFIIGHWADTPVASTTALIEQYQPGGVIIMSAPENPPDILGWTKQWNAVSDRPLLIAVDQEGGPVSRLRGEQFIATGQRQITSTSQARSVGKTRGQQLAALGINMNFAPVLDTAHNPTSFLYDRTFPNESDAANLAAALSAGMAESGVTAVIKHFPGHDDTSVDSHHELPIVDITAQELDSFTQPFIEIIADHPPAAIMTAHVQFPQIDPLPATLSKYFLTTYLREQLGYQGLIITDDMSMDAIATHYEQNQAALLALEAGADMILLAAQPADIEAIIPFLQTQLTESSSLQEQVAGSFQRVQQLK